MKDPSCRISPLAAALVLSLLLVFLPAVVATSAVEPPAANAVEPPAASAVDPSEGSAVDPSAASAIDQDDEPAVFQTVELPAASAVERPAASAVGPSSGQGWVGIQLGTPPPTTDGTAPPEGVPITGVVAGSPAQAAGLRARDRILAVDGRPVSKPQDIIGAVAALQPESWVSFSIQRSTHEMDLRVYLGTRPREGSSLRLIEGWIGAEAIDLPPDLREHFGAPRDAGVMISRVLPDGPGFASGLDLGDVVFEVAGEPIRTSRSLQQAISGGGLGNRLEIRLMRDGAEIVVEPLIEMRPEK